MLSIFVFLIKHKDCSMLWTSFLQIDLVRLCLLWFQFWFIWFELLSLDSCFRNSLSLSLPYPLPSTHKPTSPQAHKHTSPQAHKPRSNRNPWETNRIRIKSMKINRKNLWKSMRNTEKVYENQWTSLGKSMEIHQKPTENKWKSM